MVQGRHWCFTIWDPKWRHTQLNNNQLSKIQYCIYSLEKGKNGSNSRGNAARDHGRNSSEPDPHAEHGKHIQGYLECLRSLKPGSIKLLLGQPTVHLEIRKGTRAEARDYCRKSDTHLSGPWEYGIWREAGQGRRTDVAELKDVIDTTGSILACFEHDFGATVRMHRGLEKYLTLTQQAARAQYRILTVIWIWGPTRTGKTRHVYDSSSAGNVYPLTIREPLWFDGYENQETLLLDDFSDSKLPLHQLLVLLDGHPTTVQVKGGMTWAGWNKVFITTNRHPNEFYPGGTPERNALTARISKIGHKPSLHGPILWETTQNSALDESKETSSQRQSASASPVQVYSEPESPSRSSRVTFTLTDDDD